MALSVTLEQYFSNILNQLQAGLPDIQCLASPEKEDDSHPAIDDMTHVWRCGTCTFANETEHSTCQMCNGARP